MSKRGFKTTQAKVKATRQSGDMAAAVSVPRPTPSWKLLALAFRLFERNATTVSFVVILPTLLLQLGSSLVNSSQKIDVWALTGVFLQFSAGLLLLANIVAPYVMQIRIVRGRRPGVWEVYRDSVRFIPRIVGFGMLFGILLFGGVLLFVAPGLIVLRRYFLTPYFLIEEDIGIREAMQRSAAATKPVRRHVWTILGILLAFAAVGFGLAELFASYGQLLAALLPAVYMLLPALRYREAADMLRAATTNTAVKQ